MIITELSKNKSEIYIPKHVEKIKSYTICTLANDNYLEFLYYFTKSALDKCENMSELIILYTGENFIEDPIYQNNKIKIIKYKESIKTNQIWDIGWQKNVDLKTRFLRDLSIQSDKPVFLIDVDCFFLSDFIDVVKSDVDIVVTHRPLHHLPYIASFVGLINPKKCIPFIDFWRNEMLKIKNVPRETRALVNTIYFFKNNVKTKIQELNESTISCIHYNSPTNDTKILHFKGTRVKGDIKVLLNNRLSNLKKFVK